MMKNDSTLRVKQRHAALYEVLKEAEMNLTPDKLTELNRLRKIHGLPIDPHGLNSRRYAEKGQEQSPNTRGTFGE